MVAPGESLHSEIVTGAENYYVLHKKFKYHHPKGTGELSRAGEKEEMSTLTSTSSEPLLPAEDSNKDGRESASMSSVDGGDVEITTGNQTPPTSPLKTGNGDANPSPKDKPQYLIKWNRFEDQVCNAFAELFCSDEFVDVTLSCEGEILRAHQVVLGLSSSFFRKLFQKTPCKHPVVTIKGIALNILKSILQYIYLGQVVVQRNEIHDFMDAADYLGIGGALAHLYSCEISAASTVDESGTERDDSECSSVKYPEETGSSTADKHGEPEKVEQSEYQEAKEGSPGESDCLVFKYQGVKSRWHRRYNSTSYSASSPVNVKEQMRSASTGGMETKSTVAGNSIPETGLTKIEETLVPVEAPRDVEMGSVENDERDNESVEDQMRSTIEEVHSPEISTTRKIVKETFHQRKEYSNLEFETAKAQWEDWRNKGHPGVAKYHQSSLSSSHTHPPLAAFSSGSSFSDTLDCSRMDRHSSFTYEDESDLYNRKYTGSLDSTSKWAYEHHHRHMQGHNFSHVDHALNQPQISQFQDTRHRHHEKSFPVSSHFSMGIGSPSSSSLTPASSFASVSSSMNVIGPKTKAIRSSQVPQSSRYTAAEVDEMVDAVAHIPGNIVPCALCQKYVKRERLRSHIHECHLLTGEKIICPHCGIALKSKGSYRVHIWRHKRGALPTPSGIGSGMSMPAFRVNHPSGPPQ